MASGNKTQVLGLKLSKKGGELIQKLTASNELLELLEVESSLEEFERRAMSVRPGLMVIEYRSNLPALVDLLERLRVQLPSSPVVALSKGKDPDEIIQAMRLGVREFLVIGPELLASFSEAVLRLKQPTAADEPTGRIIGIMGAKGGVGTSSIAVNLAWGLSQVHAQRVALVDLDLYGGNQAFLLDMEPERDFSDVAREFDRLDQVLLDSFMVEVAPALRMLGAPEDPSEAEVITSEHVLTVLDELAKTHAYVLCDLGDGLEESTLAAMDRSEKILLVLEPTLVGVKAALRTALLSQRLGHDEDKTQFIVNRANARRAVRAGEINGALGRNALAFLPNDYPTLTEASNIGRPVLRFKPKCPWAKSLMKTAKGLHEVRKGAKA
jgi:pilus assembly protein CpaE